MIKRTRDMMMAKDGMFAPWRPVMKVAFLAFWVGMVAILIGEGLERSVVTYSGLGMSVVAASVLFINLMNWSRQ